MGGQEPLSTNEPQTLRGGAVIKPVYLEGMVAKVKDFCNNTGTKAEVTVAVTKPHVSRNRVPPLPFQGITQLLPVYGILRY